MGTEDYNQDLSEQRAQAVADAIAECVRIWSRRGGFRDESAGGGQRDQW